MLKMGGGGRPSNVYKISTFYHWFFCPYFLLLLLLWNLAWPIKTFLICNSNISRCHLDWNIHVHFLVVLLNLVFLLLLFVLERIVEPISPNLVSGLWVTSISFHCPLKTFVRSQAAQAALETFASIFMSFIECLG